MKWVLNFAPKYKLKYWLSNAMIIGGDLISLIPPILIGIIIDEGLFNQNFSLAIILGIVVVLITIFRVGIAYFGVVNIDVITNKIGKELRLSAFSKLNEMDQSYFAKNNLGEVSSVLTTDIRHVIFFMQYVFKTLVVMILSFVFTLIYGLVNNWILILSTLMVTPIMIFIYVHYQKRVVKMYQERRDIYSDLSNCVQENIEGNLTVKNFFLEKNQTKRFQKINHVLENKTVEINSLENSHFTIINFLAYSMEIILIFVGGILFIKGQITLGLIITLYNLMWSLQAPFYELGSLLSYFNDFKVSLKKIKELLSTEVKIKNSGSIYLEDIKTIEFKNITVKYDKKYAIKDFNLKIKAGQTIAFIGEVGSGKSTIVNLLLRTVEPTKGSILINNKDIKDYELKRLREVMGYVAQQPFLFSESIYENVSFGVSLEKDEIHPFIKMASADYVYKLENGIDTVIGENGVTLSGGEKQRLTLARALAKQPKVLILDDITSALDTETELEVTKNINTLKYECTKIIVGQKILSVKNADIICVLKNNKVIEMGNHKSLIQNKGYYAEINDYQNKTLGGEA